MSSVPTSFEGPVCNLNAKVNVQQPPIQSAPQIPVANDLPSALQAIQSMSQILQVIINQLPGPNNIIQQNNAKQPSGGNFQEVPGSRQSQNVRIYNPSDHTQYVDVNQVTYVKFANKLGQNLVYSNPVGS